MFSVVWQTYLFVTYIHYRYGFLRFVFCKIPIDTYLLDAFPCRYFYDLVVIV